MRSKYKSIILYSISLAVMLFVLRWLEFRLVVISHAFEIYIGAIAVIFTGLGIWLALKLAKPKTETVIVEREIFRGNEFILNQQELQRLGISVRELEVLQLIAKGYSNNEIAEALFVSTNTVKTHSSKLFEKLGVNRRTQAVEQGKKLGLIA